MARSKGKHHLNWKKQIFTAEHCQTMCFFYPSCSPFFLICRILAECLSSMSLLPAYKRFCSEVTASGVCVIATPPPLLAHCLSDCAFSLSFQTCLRDELQFLSRRNAYTTSCGPVLPEELWKGESFYYCKRKEMLG